MGISTKEQQTRKIREGRGFIFALDQSGGSTPDVLKKYNVPEDLYIKEGKIDEPEMHRLVHEFRSRIITSSPLKTGQLIGAILFERTMDSQVKGKPTGDYLWQDRSIVPFVKIDKGLANEEDGVQLLKPMPELDSLLQRAADAGIFGTKMRSIIFRNSPSGIEANVRQQFEVAAKILDYGLVPIIEPEVDIKAADKAECEVRLKEELFKGLEGVPAGKQVIFKINLPEVTDFYKDLSEDPKTLKVVAMSGGYSLEEACRRLSQNTGIIASFSRAMTHGLSYSQSDAAFNATLQKTVDKVWAASLAPTVRF